MAGAGVLLLVFLLALSWPLDKVGEALALYGKPSSCNSLECPSYEVIHYHNDFEIRSYKKDVWMSTRPIVSNSYREAANAGFFSLFAYIQGKNDRGARMEMTAPVLVDVAPSSGPLCNSSFAVRLYVPAKYQAHPPRSDELHSERWPSRRYAAVRRFGGFMDDANIPPQASALADSLRGTQWEAAATAGAGGSNRPATYTVAGYNSPFESQGRVNEVMFLFD